MDEAPVTLQTRLETPPAIMLEGLAVKVFITGGVSGGGGDDGVGENGVGDGVNCEGAGDDGVNCGDDDDGVNCEGCVDDGGDDEGGDSDAVVVPIVTVTDLLTLPEALMAVMV